jgi:hypothetical protein
MLLGSRQQEDVQRTTQGSTAIFAAPATGRYSVKDIVITGNVHATGTVKVHSATHVLAEYIPTYGHPSIHFSGEGLRLEEGEALTLTTGVADFLVNVVAIVYQIG